MKEPDKDTMEAIIQGAAQEFSRHGFAGARMDRIAKKAGVNKASIYYHVGDKEKLYEQVLKTVFEKAGMRIEAKIKEAETPEEKLRIYIRNIARVVDENPHLPSIMLQEVGSGAKNMPPAVIETLIQVVGNLVVILAEGEEKKVFIRANPFLLHLMIAGTCILFKTSAPVRSAHPMIPEFVREMGEDIQGGIQEEIENLIIRAICR